MSGRASPPAALVTGAGRGIGRAVARTLLERGWSVVVADVDEPAARDAEDEYAGLGTIRALRCDVADEDDVRRAVAAAAELGPLRGLVANAGIADPAAGPVERLERARWDRVLAVNLTGVMLCVKHAVPHLRAAGGAVVAISSSRSLMSEPHTEPYSASKGGVAALTHALAVSLGPEVRVNAIAPGWIATSAWEVRSERREPELRAADHAQHPVGRVGRPEDVAEAAAWLLSDAAGFVTGRELVVDGGMTRKMIYEA